MENVLTKSPNKQLHLANQLSMPIQLNCQFMQYLRTFIIHDNIYKLIKEMRK